MNSFLHAARTAIPIKGALRFPAIAMLMAALSLVLAACGGSPTAVPTAAPTQPAPAATATTAPVSTPAPGETPAPTAAPTAGSANFEQEWQELIKAAQAEGEIVFSVGGSASRAYRPVFEGFGEKFGVNVVISGGSGRRAADRILAERSAGKFTVDVIETGSTTSNTRLIPGNVLDPIAPLFIHPDVLDKSLWYRNRHWYADPDQKFVFSFSASVDNPPIGARYNTNLVSQEEIDSINSVFDYLNPKWADGKIVAIPPVVAGAGGTWYTNFVSPGIGPEWIERFIKDMKPFWAEDARLISDGLVRGKFHWAIAIGSVGDDIDDLAEKGLPAARIEKEFKEPGTLGATGSSNVVSVANRAPHPNATKLFVNWFLSKEGQTFRQLNSSTSVDMTLREDVTEFGVTRESERRKPGVIYQNPDNDPELILKRDEAMAFAQRLYRESLGR